MSSYNDQIYNKTKTVKSSLLTRFTVFLSLKMNDCWCLFCFSQKKGSCMLHNRSLLFNMAIVGKMFHFLVASLFFAILSAVTWHASPRIYPLAGLKCIHPGICAITEHQKQRVNESQSDLVKSAHALLWCHLPTEVKD